MKKETLIAVILGMSFGIGVAVFVLISNQKQQFQKAKSFSTILNVTPTGIAQNLKYEPLEISQPENQKITSEKTVVIKGRAKKDSLLVLQSPIKNSVIRTDGEEFSVDFPLAFGENVIQMTVYPKNNRDAIQEKELIVYQLDEQ
ncbi:MAG: hypothetical protein WCO06_04410 [Candidatus Roizmanbacteria bacterium]